MFMRIELACVGALLAFVVLDASAQAIQVEPGDCRSGVRLIARQASLADVLKQLAQALDFELRYEGDQARLVNVNATRPPVDLISTLSTQDSMIVTQAKDPKCPGRNRIVKVWVLPITEPSSRNRSTAPNSHASPAASPPARTFVREQVVRGSPDLDEQSRRAKAAYDEYVRIHGVPPPGVEEEAAKN